MNKSKEKCHECVEHLRKIHEIKLDATKKALKDHGFEKEDHEKFLELKKEYLEKKFDILELKFQIAKHKDKIKDKLERLHDHLKLCCHGGCSKLTAKIEDLIKKDEYKDVSHEQEHKIHREIDSLKEKLEHLKDKLHENPLGKAIKEECLGNEELIDSTLSVLECVQAACESKREEYECHLKHKREKWEKKAKVLEEAINNLPEGKEKERHLERFKSLKEKRRHHHCCGK